MHFRVPLRGNRELIPSLKVNQMPKVIADNCVACGACVDACPSLALHWGPIEELRAEHGDEAGISPLPDPSFTKPHLVIKPHRDAQRWDGGTGAIMNPKEI